MLAWKLQLANGDMAGVTISKWRYGREHVKRLRNSSNCMELTTAGCKIQLLFFSCLLIQLAEYLLENQYFCSSGWFIRPAILKSSGRWRLSFLTLATTLYRRRLSELNHVLGYVQSESSSSDVQIIRQKIAIIGLETCI